jgi:hypothetical protein
MTQIKDEDIEEFVNLMNKIIDPSVDRKLSEDDIKRDIIEEDPNLFYSHLELLRLMVNINKKYGYVRRIR